MMKFVDKYVNEDKNNNPIIFKTKKNIIITGTIFFWVVLLLSSFVTIKWPELSVVLLLSAFPFAYAAMSYIKIEKPSSFWTSFSYQVLPPIFMVIVALIKEFLK